MRRLFSLRASFLSAALIASGALSAANLTAAGAQAFGPPMTLFGSVSDSAGAVDAGLTVETYVGTTVCGSGRTEFVGEGASRVTVYAADVVSREQTSGCGAAGVDVRVKVGDRFATQTRKWEQGPRQLDITFGSATPAPIPTFTPTPRRTPTAAPTRAAGTTVPGATSAATPPAGSTASAAASTQPGDGTPTSAAARRTVSTQADGNLTDDSGGGFPAWAGIVFGLGLLAAIGGAVGLFLSHRRPPGAEDGPPPL